MTYLVVWAGPVANFQIPGATVEGAKRVFINCLGDRQPSCPVIGNLLMTAPGKLLARAAVAPGDLHDLYLGAYSAGGSVHGRLVRNPDYRKLVTALLLSDASYTAQWLNKAKRIPPPITGYVDYAVDVINGPGDKLFIATASPNPNGQWATGIENLQATAAEIERRTGGTFEEYDFPISPKPDRAYRLGNVIFAEFPKTVGHGEHVTLLAPKIWKQMLQPWIDKGKGPIGAPGGVAPSPHPHLPPTPVPVPIELPSSRDLGIVAAAAAFTFWMVNRARRT